MANEVTIHVKSENRTDMDLIGRQVTAKAKTSFLRTGGHAGAAFAAGFIKTITLGQVGSGFAMAATKLKPQMAHLGGGLGVALAAAVAVKLANSLSALLPLALGAGILALPIAGIIKKQLNVMKDIEKVDAKILTQKDKIAHSTGEARKEAEKELSILEKQKKELQEQAKHLIRLQDKAKGFMAEISKPVEVPLFKSMKLIGDRLDEWGPKFAKAIKPLAKELPGFVEGALKGIENFASEIGKKMPSITKGFREWGKELPGIGEALGKMLADWIGDIDETKAAVQDLSSDLKGLARAVGSVGKAFQKFGETNNAFAEAMENQREMILKWRVTMLRAVLAVVEAWAKINPRMESVAKHLRKSLDIAQEEIDETREKAKKLHQQKVETKLRADKKEAQAKIADIDRRLKKTNDAKVISKLKADKANAQNALNYVNARLAALNGKTATTYIKTVHIPVYGKDTMRKTATGGIIGGIGINAHAAEGGSKRAQVLVGEQGPEIVDLPMGSHVNSNPDSQRMMANSGRGDITINVMAPNYVGTPSDLLKALVDAKRRGQLDVILR